MTNFWVKIIVATIVFIFAAKYRKKISKEILRIPLPKIVLCLLTCIPLIIFEEQINCQPWWCGKVLIPPTLTFLFVEILILLIIIKILKLRSVIKIAIFYGIFGLAFELIFGGLIGIFRAGPIAIFFLIWTFIWYMFLVLIPLTILLESKQL